MFDETSLQIATPAGLYSRIYQPLFTVTHTIFILLSRLHQGKVLVIQCINTV